MLEPRNAVLLGDERARAIDEHLDWLNGRWPSEMLRQLDRRHCDADSPIASWSRVHSRKLAISRARRRIKRKPWRIDDAPPLVDDLTDDFAATLTAPLKRIRLNTLETRQWPRLST